MLPMNAFQPSHDNFLNLRLFADLFITLLYVMYCMLPFVK